MMHLIYIFTVNLLFNAIPLITQEDASFPGGIFSGC